MSAVEERIMLKVKAGRIARWTTRGFWVGMVGLLVLLTITLGDRLRLMLGERFWWIAVLTLMMLMFGTLVLHLFVFPKKFPEYPAYRNEEVDLEVLFPNLRLKIASVIVLIVAVISFTIDRHWPVGTIPRELPKTFYYAVDGLEIRGGEFGTMAYPMSNDELWVCRQVEAYGPFDYAGESHELVMNRVFLIDIIDTETSRYIAEQGGTWRWLVKFNHYEDGDWMIVKLFVRSYESTMRGYLDLDGADAILTLNAMVESGAIEYDVYEFDDNTDEIATLKTAIDGILDWWEIGDGLIWTVEPVVDIASGDEL